MEKRRIYVDNSATTPIHPQVLEEMMPYLTESFGNPSSIHFFGREARRLWIRPGKGLPLEVGAKTEEIYFTGSGTRADNWAVKVALLTRKEKDHIITTKLSTTQYSIPVNTWKARV